MTEEPTQVRSGRFIMAPGRTVYGELRLAGPDSSLFLQDDEFLHAGANDGNHIIGTLLDLTKVTLIDCLATEDLGSVSRDGQHAYHARVFPHYVVEGDQHLVPSTQSISSARFVVDGATTLFNDVAAFSKVSAPESFIVDLVAANRGDALVEVGPEPQVAYFTGKREIVAFDTAIGRIAARHNPGWSVGGPRGVRIDNVVSVELSFAEPLAFPEVVSRVARLVKLLGLLVGRPQLLSDMYVRLGAEEPPRMLRVHWSHLPSTPSGAKGERGGPHPSDLPLDPIRRKAEFAQVVQNWFSTDAERQDARLRFFNCFEQGRTYSVDRLVAAANMFDILPPSASPSDVALSKDLLDAKRQSRSLFLSLPDSYERQSVLGALGRLGKASLKHKTAYRAARVTEEVGDLFPELVFALGAAIDCRNHYVHGSKPKFDYLTTLEVCSFLTNTLEFTYAASELVEAGWDIKAYYASNPQVSHPLGTFRWSYGPGLRRLKELLCDKSKP